MKKDSTSKANAKRLVLLFWILVLIFYFYLSYDYIRISSADTKFQDYLDHVVQLAGNDNRPSKETRALILVKADELGIPIQGDQITILGGGRTLNISLSYDVEVDFPIFRKGFYTKHFEHKVTYNSNR
jgi:hypothetical protein